MRVEELENTKVKGKNQSTGKEFSEINASGNNAFLTLETSLFLHEKQRKLCRTPGKSGLTMLAPYSERENSGFSI